MRMAMDMREKVFPMPDSQPLTLAKVIHDSFLGMQGWEGPSDEEPNAGDAQLAFDILAAGYKSSIGDPPERAITAYLHTGGYIHVGGHATSIDILKERLMLDKQVKGLVVYERATEGTVPAIIKLEQFNYTQLKQHRYDEEHK